MKNAFTQNTFIQNTIIQKKEKMQITLVEMAVT